MVDDRIPRGASPSLPKNFPSLDPEAVARAAESQRQAIAAQSPNYQQMLYQQALDTQQAQLAQNIARSRSEATIATSYTPNPRSAASPTVSTTGRPPSINPVNSPRAAPPVSSVGNSVVQGAVGTYLVIPSLVTALQNIGIGVDNVSRIVTGRPQRPYIPYQSWFQPFLDRLFPNRSRSNDALTAPQPLPTIPPFYGGQSEGVLYQVTTRSRQTNEYGYEGGGTNVKQVRGRILGVRYDNGNYYIQSSNQGDVLVEYLNPIYYYNGQPREYQISFTVVSVVRADGETDTGGNPPPSPGATRPEGQRSPAIAPSRNISPVVTPERPIPNNPNPAGQARAMPTPTPAIVPTSAKPSSPLHPKNLSPGKAINPFKSVPDPAPNPVAPAGNAELAPAVVAATAPSSISRPIATPTTAGQQQPGETTQDYISRVHDEQLQRFRNSANLGFTNPFENLSSNILEQNPTTATATPSLNPLIPALGVAGLVGAGAVIARRTIPSGLQTANPTTTGNPTAPVTARPTRTQTTTTPQTPEFPGTGTGEPTLSCSYDSRNISGKVDQTNATLGTIQLFLQEQVLSKVSSIDNKMGNTALTGGVTGALNTIGNTVQTIQNFSKKTWDFLQIDRILSILTYITVLHNAYMLSSALTQTLFSAISNILDATGLDEFLGLVDSDDEEVNVGELVGKATDSFFKSIFGVETVDGIKKTWKKYNRIYQSATNMLYSIQSMVFSMVEILETISDYTGKIGNALRKSGTVLQNAFNWMNPSANYQNGKFFRYLNNIQEAVEVIDEIASEIVSIQDSAEELFDQKQEFDKAVQDAEKKVSDDENKNKTDSTRPLMNITRQDEQKVEGT